MKNRTAAFLLFCGLLLIPMSARSEEIHDAARKGDLERIRTLVESDPGIVHLKDQEGRTPLHWACLGGRTEVISFLVGKGAEVNVLDKGLVAPLHRLAGRNHKEGIILLLNNGADPDILDNQQNSPLHLAAQANAVDAAKALADHGAELELKNDYGRTPLLMCARERGGPEMTSLLIEAGADVNARDRSGATPLELSAWRGKKAVVDTLLDAGAVAPAKGLRSGRLMMYAASQGLEKLFERLEAGGADWTRPLRSGGSFLHEAAAGDSLRIATKLIDKGLDVGQKDKLGWAPLHYAALNGRTAVARLLIERGANVDIRNASGQSPFNIAGEMKQDDVCKALIAAGASQSPASFPLLEGEYLGQKPPGDEPEVFALGIVSSIWGLHSTVVFSPDGSTALWVPMVWLPGQIYSTGIVYEMTRSGDHWTAPRPASFSGEWDDDVPFFSPDGRRLYFISARPLPVEGNPRKEAIWYVERQGELWSEAEALPWAVNKNEMHWQFSMDRQGSIYFGSGMAGGYGGDDIYCVKFSEGHYSEPENVGSAINSDGMETTPFVTPDGTTLIFMKNMDLYVSFKRNDGQWTEAKNLGRTVNSSAMEICPVLTPDGKYLFFVSSRDGENRAWWVDAGIIDKLRQDVTGR